MAKPDANYGNKDFKFNGAMILKLYDEKCAICESKKDWMEIHHIDIDNENNDPSNLIPVCKDCHMVVHSRRFNLKLEVDIRVLNLARMILEMLKSSPRSNISL